MEVLAAYRMWLVAMATTCARGAWLQDGIAPTLWSAVCAGCVAFAIGYLLGAIARRLMDEAVETVVLREWQAQVSAYELSKSSG